jgi:basic amino acid/polyamine antiporter, APA family
MKASLGAGAVAGGSTGSLSPSTTPESKLLRVVGLWGLAAGIVNTTVGGGIFRLPAGVYAQLGDASPIAYVVCAVVMGLVVTCFAEAGSRVSLTGGLYAYIEVAFGPLVGFVSGLLLWAGMTAAVSAVAVFLGDAVAALIPSLGSTTMHTLVIVTIFAALGGLNILGVGNATRFNIVMTVAKIAPLAVIIIAGVVGLHADRLAIAHAPAAGKLARGSVFLIFAFLGVESALVPSGEVRDPARTVPRALTAALVAIVLIYMCVQLVTQSALGPSLATAKTPVADAAGVLLGSSGRTMILIGTIVSMFGYVSGMTLAVPRILYAFSRDGFMFKRLASVHPRFRTPHVAIIIQTLINAALATTGTFEQLAIAANGSILLVYGACALAVLVLRRKNVEMAQKPFVAPFGGIIPVLSFLVIAWLLLSLTGREWIALAVIAAAAVVIFAATASTRARMALT